MSFIRLKSSPGFYLVFVENMVEFDQKNSPVRFIDFHPCCRNSEQIIRSSHTIIKDEYKLEEFGSAKSDLRFGQFDRKTNAVYISASIGKALIKFKLSGICFIEMRNNPDE